MPGPDCITRFLLLDRENRSDLSVQKSGTRAGPKSKPEYARPSWGEREAYPGPPPWRWRESDPKSFSARGRGLDLDGAEDSLVVGDGVRRWRRLEYRLAVSQSRLVLSSCAQISGRGGERVRRLRLRLCSAQEVTGVWARSTCRWLIGSGVTAERRVTDGSSHGISSVHQV
jgi:hypothetical protein